MYLKRINKIFASAGTDALYITAPKEIFYLSGFTGSEAALYITPEKRYIMTDSRYFLQAAEQAADFELADVSKIKLRALVGESIKSIGFLQNRVTYAGYEKIKKETKGASLVGVSDAVSLVRQIKDADEVNKIRTAAKIADDGFSHILKYIRAGMSENEVALELEFFMRKRGASGLSFETVCASGKRSAMPHGTATDKIIENGELLTLDFGCVYKGYVSDMTRTVVIGGASDEQRGIYELVKTAQLAALEKIHAGAEAKAVDAVARGLIAENGYGERFGHGLGHSLGLEVHEMPSLSPKSDAVLKSGMLMTVEPGIYIEGFGGVRIEDLVLITATGCENLTHSDKNFLEI